MKKNKTTLQKTARKYKNSRDKKILIGVVATVLIMLTLLLVNSINSEEQEEGGVEESTGRAPLPDDRSDSNGDSDDSNGETVFQEEYNPEDLPTEKQDYAQHQASLINEGIFDYYILCQGRSFSSDEGEGSYSIEPNPDAEICQRENIEDASSIEDLDNSTEIIPFLEQSVDEEVDFLSSLFSSLESGSTNNPADAFNEDGSRNWDYSFVLAEDIRFFFAHQVERLINPHYGEWSQFQHSSSNASEMFPHYLFRSLFSQDYWYETVGRPGYDQDPSGLPFFADWNSDNYQSVLEEANIDKDLTDEDIRWTGEIDDYDFDYRETVDGRSFEIGTTLDITYYSTASDGSTIELPALLDITIVPNYNNPDLATYRLVIDEAELSINP